MGLLRGRKALVTGAGHGIAKAIARALIDAACDAPCITSATSERLRFVARLLEGEKMAELS